LESLPESQFKRGKKMEETHLMCPQEIHDMCECALPVLSEEQIEELLVKTINECHKEWVAAGIVK
jgi:hypothetical protein